MPNIQWIEEKDAEGAAAAGYAAYFRKRPDRTTVAPIIKCFSHRPDFMQQVMDFSWGLHFCDGHLTEKVKEMIATVVSGQNRCPYCMHSHAYFLNEHGAPDEAVACLGRGEIDAAPITEGEKALMRYVKKLTNESYRSTPADAQALREAGWGEPQIAEAVYITALFAFFNRVANAFGLADPQYYQMENRSDPLAGFLKPVGTE